MDNIIHLLSKFIGAPVDQFLLNQISGGIGFKSTLPIFSMLISLTQRITKMHSLLIRQITNRQHCDHLVDFIIGKSIGFKIG